MHGTKKKHKKSWITCDFNRIVSCLCSKYLQSTRPETVLVSVNISAPVWKHQAVAQLSVTISLFSLTTHSTESFILRSQLFLRGILNTGPVSRNDGALYQIHLASDGMLQPFQSFCVRMRVKSSPYSTQIQSIIPCLRKGKKNTDTQTLFPEHHTTPSQYIFLNSAQNSINSIDKSQIFPEQLIRRNKCRAVFLVT